MIRGGGPGPSRVASGAWAAARASRAPAHRTTAPARGAPEPRYSRRVADVATLLLVEAPRRVLIVEDDPDIRAAMTDVLSAEGHLVTEAGDGVEGLERAHEQKPDLILLDLMMPRMDGWGFRAAQRADSALAGVPVVIVSACIQERSGEALDAAAYLQKPFDLDELLQVIARVPAPTGA